jgi:hypothetical protein
MSILNLICSNGFITVNRTIASIVGLEAAAVLGEIATEYLYWQEHDPDFNGEFYSTIENLESRTFLSAYSQRIALNKLQEQGWIQVRKKGMPAKRFIRVFEDKILIVVNDKSSNFLTTGGEKNEQQVVKNFNINNNITKDNRKEELSNNSIIADDPLDFLPDKGNKKFIPPTVEEVKDYCRKRGNNIDAEKFVAYYSSTNWYRGKTKIKNWKACVITWEKRTEKETNTFIGNPFTELLKQEGYE